MVSKEVFEELIKRGYSEKDGRKVWDISASRFWYHTPELAKGYLEFKEYKPYKIKVVDAEIDILRKQVAEALREGLGDIKNINVIDLGCGDGEKARVLLSALDSDFCVKYCPVDISDHLLDLAVSNIENDGVKCVIDVKKFKTDFEDFDDVVGALRDGESQKNISLLLGETVSHYDINDLLYKISGAMFAGDCLLIGNGYRVGERFVEVEKYNNPIFDNWYGQIVRGLGFEKEDYEWDARFSEKRLEFVYKILKDKSVEFDGRRVEFKAGDEVIVAAQYKFYENELREICGRYFKKVELFKDTEREYVVIKCEK